MPYKNKADEIAYKARTLEHRRAVKAEWRRNNREKVLATKNGWYKRHREEILQKQKDEREQKPEIVAARKKSYYENNKAEILLKQKEYKSANPEKVKQAHRNNYLANKQKRNATSKAYYEANKERLAKWQLDYNRKNKVRRNALQLIRRSNDRDHYRAKAREYANRRYLRDADLLKTRAKAFVAKHPEKVAARRRAYRQANRDKCYAANNKRLTAIQKATIGNVDEIKTLVTAWNSDPNTCCYYCGAPIYGTKFHVDHIIPISRNGAHHIDNLCPSCSLCNLTKHDKLVSEWRPELSAEPVGRSLG